MGRSHAWKIVRCLVHQGAGKIVGSTTGATPNATDTMANPIKTIEAHTPKSASDEFWRSCIGTRRDRIVDENKVMSISNRFLRTNTVVGERSEVRSNAQGDQ